MTQVASEPTHRPDARDARGDPGQLAHGSIGIAQDVILGMASSAPAASVGLTLAALAAATSYGSGPILVLTAIPMLVIANAYRRLNMWNQNCGGAYEWVSKAISPDLGFLVGWVMIAAYVLATVSGVEVLGPSVLTVFGSNASSTLANVGIAVGVGAVMTLIAVVGITITARTQVSMAVIEYVILIGFAIVGIVAVVVGWHGTYHLSSGWLSPTGVGGHGGLAAGFLIAVFIFTGWDGAIYVNEESENASVNPGRAALIAVAALAVVYTVSIVGLQGTVSPARLQANGASALVYTAQSLGGGGWAKVMALSLALSTIATTGTGILLTARIVYSMSRDRVLPSPLAKVSARYETPVLATVLTGATIVALACVYLVATGIQNAFNDVVDVAGMLFAVFYIFTALATVVYYRRKLAAGLRDALVIGVAPLAAAVFLGWVDVKSIIAAPAGQAWSLVGVFVVGVLLLGVARFVLHAPLFAARRESWHPETDALRSGAAVTEMESA